MSTDRNPKLWIVAADGAHAMVLEPDRVDGRYREVGEERAPGYPHAHGRHDATHNLAAADKTAFAHDLARRLDASAAAGAFDQLVLVAPGHTLHDVRAALGTKAAKAVTGTESKDIIKLPILERDSHLAKWWISPG